MPRKPTTPRTVLVVAASLSREIGAERAGATIARGVEAGASGRLDAAPWPLFDRKRPLDDQLADGPGTGAFPAALREARAVVVAARALWDGRGADELVARDPLFEAATRARQGGVPAYAVLARPLSPFDARILDLQVVLLASTPRALLAAGRRLAGIV